MWHRGNARLWQKVLATDSTDSSFASKVPTVTEPVNDGVVNVSPTGNNIIPRALKIIPYATANDNDTFDMRVTGWQRVGAGAGSTGQPPTKTLWIPVPLAQFTCTASQAVGVAAAPVINTQRFADTIIIHATIVLQPKTTDVNGASAASRGNIEIVSAANNLIGLIVMPLFSSEKFEITFSGSVTGMNALYALFA